MADLPGGIYIILICIGFNFIGDALRDALRPGYSAGRTGSSVAPLLEIEDLHTHITLREGTVRAVDGVTLHVDPGETLGIVGESGCGKTMTALSIMGLLPVGGHIADGSIHLAGQRISGLSDEHMRKIRGDEIGMIFQDPLTSLNPTTTVGKQIAEVVLLHREVSKEQAMERAAEVLGLVGLPAPKSGSTSTRTSSPAGCGSAS